ncbi:MAG: hypothetical protein SF053_20055 [Bacteroidia bacterium]|nr:hypothetical protein [Bacteroidia bacterium]
MRRLYVAGWLLGLIAISLPVAAQHFKVYYEFRPGQVPQHLAVHGLTASADGKTLALAGELKEVAPVNTARGWTLRLKPGTELLRVSSHYTNFNNAQNGIAVRDIALDSRANLYIAGASVQHFGSIGGGSERVLSSEDLSGRMRWGQMQANNTFESVVVDDTRQVITALSGPAQAISPLGVVVTQVDAGGHYLRDVVLRSTADDAPVRILLQERSGELIAVAVHDTATQAKPWLIWMDRELNVTASLAYQLAGYELLAADAALAPDGRVAVAGTAIRGGISQPFMLLVQPDGTPEACWLYAVAGGAAWGTAVSAVSNRQYEGFFVGGYTETAPGRRESFLLHADISGDAHMAWDLSEFRPGDHTYDETLARVLYMPALDRVVVTGDMARFRPNGLVDMRSVWVFQSTPDELYSDPVREGCMQGLTVRSQAVPVGIRAIGRVTQGVSTLAFGWQQQEISFRGTYCFYESQRTGPLATPLEAGFAPELVGPGHTDIFDLSGRLILSVPFVQTPVRPENLALAPGLYLITVNTRDVPPQTYKYLQQ